LGNLGKFGLLTELRPASPYYTAASTTEFTAGGTFAAPTLA
jgi:hypothetical protein